MTSNREEYLKAIWYLGGRERRVPMKEITQRLNVQSASVTEMLGRLTREGLLKYEPYHGVRLSEKGIQICTDLVRSHELWEVFLVEHLGYRTSEAHREADILEHATSPKLMEHLDQFLNYPEHCPHGAQVPRPGLLDDKRDLVKLTDTDLFDHVEIARIDEDYDLLNYLDKLNLHVGDCFELLEFGDYGGPLKMRNLAQPEKSFELSLKAAEKIEVLLLDPKELAEDIF
ncbi:MAG: metal-dependent transcriptional regulator [Eubacteriales bacterium]|nr:metal-dependent transcriptional regulator [Eubacteriales bacterium]